MAWLAATALILVYAVMAGAASRENGLSFDEGVQLAAGYNIWRNRDLRVEGANGDLIKRWATLPFLFSRPNFVPSDDAALKAASSYELARRFMFESGNRPGSLLAQGRAMVTLLGVATGCLVFWYSYRLFGVGGGLVSLTLFAFSPEMLAFGGIVSTDMSITLTLFAATCSVWRLLHGVTASRLGFSLLVTGLLVLAKPTALVIMPIAAALVVIRLRRAAPLAVRWRGVERIFVRRRAQLAAFAVLALLHVAAGWLALWAHYDFRYTASPSPADASLVFAKLPNRDGISPLLARTMDWLERTRAVPEGYRIGIDALLASDDGHGAFMNGEWKVGGWPMFFPYAIWVKTHPALFVLLLGGAIAVWLTRRDCPATVHPDREYRSTSTLWYAAAPHLTLVAVLVAVAMLEDLNIGHRHVLPIYPACYVLAGAAGLAWRRTRWLSPAIGLPLAWLAADSLAVRPHYLAYFGPQAGGPANGYKHLVDSSLDWGTNLPHLKQWLDREDPNRSEPLFLAYFGTDSPEHHGIQAKRLPGFVERRTFELFPLTPGHYAISATLLQGVYTSAFGRWSREYENLYRGAMQNTLLFESTASDPAKRAELLRRAPQHAWMMDADLFDNLRFARLCAWLRHRGDPPQKIGHAMFVWKLSYADLEAALLGAPVELVEEPPVIRRFRRFEPGAGAQPPRAQD